MFKHEPITLYYSKSLDTSFNGQLGVPEGFARAVSAIHGHMGEQHYGSPKSDRVFVSVSGWTPHSLGPSGSIHPGGIR